MNLSLFRPNVASFGYGLTLAVSATTIWGGALPMLPLEMQSFGLLTTLFTVQSIALAGTFAASMICSFRFPDIVRGVPVSICVFITLFGSICLIVPLYLPSLLVPLIIVGGVLLGMGNAAFLLLWQRFFASQDADEGNLNLIVGTGYSAAIYVVLHVIPMAVAAFMTALIFVPLIGLCLVLADQQTDYRQPMFDDVPRKSPQAYRQVSQNRWKPALCVGCFGFLSGMARALALSDPSMSFVVNIASMTGSLISALALVFLWQRYSFRFDPVLAFRAVFPFIATLLLVLPFVGLDFLRLFAGVMHMLFTFAAMIMMIQCAQTSRDYGVSPTFVYGLFGAVVYAMQSVGFLFAYLYVPAEGPEELNLAIIALASIWALAVVFYSVRGHLRLEETDPHSQIRAGSVEFIALMPSLFQSENKRNGSVGETDAPAGKPTSPKPEPAPRAQIGGLMRRSEEPQYQDRISMQCAVLGERYRLTARETEVMELIARRNSVPRIAELLMVSENTVRTHCKRFYAKLDIHKRQDLLALMAEVEQDPQYRGSSPN